MMTILLCNCKNLNVKICYVLLVINCNYCFKINDISTFSDCETEFPGFDHLLNSTDESISSNPEDCNSKGK